MKLVVVEQNNCGACRMLKTYLDNEYDDVEYTHVNIDEDRSSIKKYDVMATPKVLVINDEGSVLMSCTGFSMNNTTEIDLLIEQI